MLALWLVHAYVAALAWAGVVALASWPLYRRFSLILPGRTRRWAPEIFILLVTTLFLAPLVYAIAAIGHEAALLAGALSEAQSKGLPPPEWLSRIPFAGKTLLAWWGRVLSTPGGFTEWFRQINQGPVLGWIKLFGFEMVHRSIMFAITLVALYFLYRDGNALSLRILSLVQRVLGQPGKQHASRTVATIRGTVNGLVVVGLAEGLLLGISYAFAGISSPALWGALTGLLSVVPFGMPALYGGVALVLFVQGQTTAALLILVWGTLVMLVSDHIVRPLLIGDSVELPLLWIILGILGGIENFGLLGLFLGPVIMASMVALWHEWTNVRDHSV
ncbi:MAG: AI-2E family transporter [Burkholderiales bacterium]|nr:AI-2E family transporter [Burkholderiales bacterium]